MGKDVAELAECPLGLSNRGGNLGVRAAYSQDVRGIHCRPICVRHPVRLSSPNE
ncbi:hypothetical protein FTUN_7390 [Frigoriglobus tundricola]|uniref:Uncharacterized protein n=1 Tax=Frigoriglobus tundricola TaxID=2774151 RepID=A0A6M5Z051_9BACT|nr:hypothetical protein FTUN_7390 [Frigoriglobus tundricola]